MKHGVLTQMQDWNRAGEPPEYMVGGRQQWIDAAGGVPACYPILHRLGRSPTGITRVRLTSIAHSGLNLTTDNEPNAILQGKYDDDLAELSEAIFDHTIVRINHESNGFPSAPWTGWTAAKSREVFDYIAARLGGRKYQCFIWKGGGQSPDDFAPYMDVAADVWGFDAYANTTTRPNGKPWDLADRWQPAVDWINRRKGPGEIIMGEVGIVPGPKRKEVTASVRELDGVELVVWYDLAAWKFSGNMRDRVGRMMKNST